MKKNGWVVREVELTVFNRTIGVLFAPRNSVPPILEGCDGVYMHSGTKSLIVLSNEVMHGEDFFNLIIHEAFHATSHILGSIGMVLAPESEEAYAYTQAHISSAIIAYYLEDPRAHTKREKELLKEIREWVNEYTEQLDEK